MEDHAAVVAIITGALGALSVLAVRVWGEPERRMRHREHLEKIEADAEAKRLEVQERLASSWERRAERLETKLAGLDAANASLRARVETLEKQLAAAGLVHTADLATIANLREELDAHEAELAQTRNQLAERDARIARLEARVAELEEIIKMYESTFGDKKKKKGRKE